MNVDEFNYIGISLLFFFPLAWIILYSFLIFLKIISKEYQAVFGLKLTCILLFLINLSLFFYNGIYYKNLSWKTYATLGHWYLIEQEGPAIELQYTFESFLFLTLLLFLMTTIARFSRTYLHKEVGFYKFFFLISLFMTSFIFVVLGNNGEVIFIGWEIIGLTSALLISFYNFREQTVRNSFWAVVSYKICDIFFLLAIAFAHLQFHSTNLDFLLTFAQDHLMTKEILIFIFLIIIAGLAKGAQFPFVSWPMRAMEGPTSSSALYYGALSVSLGPILLIRFFDTLMFFPSARIFIIIIAILTAPVALFISKVRSDVKSCLAYSSIFHISIIYIEIALGFKWLAVFHLMANSFIRIDQFLRSLNTIQDFYENSLFFPGANIHHQVGSATVKTPFERKMYHLAINGFGLDWFILNNFINKWQSILFFFENKENQIIKLDPMLNQKSDKNLDQEGPWDLF